MRKVVTLEFTARGEEEELEDRWAIWSEQFGFTVYGQTLEEAEEAFSQALEALLNSFESDLPALRDYLDRKGVQHRLVRDSSSPRVRERPRYFERQFEVAIGAAD